MNERLGITRYIFFFNAYIAEREEHMKLFTVFIKLNIAQQSVAKESRYAFR